MAQRRAAQDSGYVVTEKGKLDAHMPGECKCNPRLVGLLIECPECGTVYGSLRDRLNDTQAYRGKKD
jgi:hypothetical protein